MEVQLKKKKTTPVWRAKGAVFSQEKHRESPSALVFVLKSRSLLRAVVSPSYTFSDPDVFSIELTKIAYRKSIDINSFKCSVLTNIFGYKNWLTSQIPFGTIAGG